MSDRVSRRELLFLALFAGSALADTPPSKVNEKDSLAVALGYVSDARRVDPKTDSKYQAGATCSTCSWYQGKPGDPAGGPCTFFPGKNVDANGWCRMWNKKA
jgi:High potential iron-sulfur protein